MSLILLLCALGLTACGTSSPGVRAWGGSEQGETAGCDSPEADRCVVLACDDGECGLFSCEDVDVEALAHVSSADGVELVRGRPLFWRAPGTYREWWQRRSGVRGGAHPIATLSLPRRSDFVPAVPQGQGKFIKHHLFPQDAKLAAYFKAGGIDIHAYTIVIPEYIHRQVHRGKGMGRGGAWNDAWRQFVIENPRPPSKEVLMRHAIELAFRFQLTGPIVPYYNTLAIPGTLGPQIKAP